jgi:hypothetical protein
MNSQEKTNAKDPFIELVDQLMRQLTANYLPADADNFTATFTTQEFQQAIEMHTGQEVFIGHVFDWLKLHGYTAHDFGNLSLMWLMRQPESASFQLSGQSASLAP